ncbi:MAG: TlpA disulfide reductase family protein [Propionibacteriaceae bacterium]|nr:TlpA disulfide reductase family protein [Propionibacteriaceae bacterium]
MSEVTVEHRPAGSTLRSVLVVLAVAVVTVGGFWWLNRPAPGGGGNSVTAIEVPGAGVAPTIGQQAPDFTATTIDGRAVRLSELRGRPVWLTFGASWCAPCRVEAPDIQRAYAAGLGNVEVISVYLGEDAAAAQSFAGSLGLTYAHVPDPERKLAAAWGVNGIPVHWFVDADGVVREHEVGILGPQRIRELVEPLAH